ncbi:MAG: hypothetical protein MI922_11270, partial [Bacteroidales bacterium]|nr:hypothetical protein [Bacteroidales bacterium]
NCSDPAEINTYYRFNHTRPSAGTRRTMKLRAYYEDMLLKNGKIKAVIDEDIFKDLSFSNHNESIGYLSPYPEILWAHLNYNPAKAASYLLINKNEQAFFKQVEKVIKSKQDILHDIDRKKYKTPSNEERLNQNFELFIEMINENSKQTMHLKGSDMYGITALLVGELMDLFIRKPVNLGFYSPGFLLKGKEEKILRTLKVDYEMI